MTHVTAGAPSAKIFPSADTKQDAFPNHQTTVPEQEREQRCSKTTSALRIPESHAKRADAQNLLHF